MRNLLKNKKAMIGGATDFVFGLVGLAVLLFVVAALIPIQSGDIDVGDMLTGLNNAQNNTMSSFTISENNNPIVNILHSFLGFIFYSTFEVVKLAINYSVNNPGFINARTLLWIIIISLIIPIIYYVIKLLILIFLVIKEIGQSLSDKRKLKRLEQTKQNESKRIQNKI